MPIFLEIFKKKIPQDPKKILVRSYKQNLNDHIEITIKINTITEIYIFQVFGSLG